MWSVIRLITGFKPLLIGLTLAISLLFAGYKSDRAAQLRVENDRVMMLNARLSTTVEEQRESILRQEGLTTELIDNLIVAESELTKLRSLLNRHDLERLSAAKPNLIETRVNDATKKVFDELERLTTP